MCLAAMSGVKFVVPGRVFSGSLSNESLSSQEKMTWQICSNRCRLKVVWKHVRDVNTKPSARTNLCVVSCAQISTQCWFSCKEVSMSCLQRYLNWCMTWSLLSLTINCIFKLIDSVRAGKHYYPTNYGELVSSTNGDVFALARSSTNHQTCNRNMSARDTKIAIGVVFRVYVQIQHGKSEDTVEVVVDPIVNENFYIKQLGFFGIQKLKMRVEDGSL